MGIPASFACSCMLHAVYNCAAGFCERSMGALISYAGWCQYPSCPYHLHRILFSQCRPIFLHGASAHLSIPVHLSGVFQSSCKHPPNCRPQGSRSHGTNDGGAWSGTLSRASPAYCCPASASQWTTAQKTPPLRSTSQASVMRTCTACSF